MNDVSERYFVKIRGRTLGPFGPDRIKQMAIQGQLTRIHMISSDGKTWHRASEYEEIFTQISGRESTRDSEQIAQTPDTRFSEQPKQTGEPQVRAPESTKCEWYYAVHGDPTGPVYDDKIRTMIATNQLSPSDQVWHDGLDDWVSIESLPEFSSMFSVRINSDSRSNADAKKEVDFSETKMIIRSTTPWVYFVAIFLYVAAGFLFLFFVLGLIAGAKANSGMVIGQSVISLVQGGVSVALAVFLNKYASTSGSFVRTEKIEYLNQAKNWLARFWIFVSIILIIWLVFAFIFILFVLSAGYDIATFGEGFETLVLNLENCL